ncbi:hypothetical protein NPIL_589371 [Nephila pilipes]|uniref:Uncharacterized protein n=1 Tax=Nephila pilipes TaxID=299642 RepID=A0A8X6TY47_NEPPI|nr:hypothetical protein NPIL_589371 [Nephila pilipes]
MEEKRIEEKEISHFIIIINHFHLVITIDLTVTLGYSFPAVNEKFVNNFFILKSTDLKPTGMKYSVIREGVSFCKSFWVRGWPVIGLDNENLKVAKRVRI